MSLREHHLSNSEHKYTSADDTTAMPSSTDGHQPSRLLDLPPELWTKIGRYISDAHPQAADWYSHKRPNPALQQPAITRTTRALRAELIPYYYDAKFIDWWFCYCGGCTWSKGHHHRLCRVFWLKCIGAHNRRLVKHASMISVPKYVVKEREKLREEHDLCIELGTTATRFMGSTYSARFPKYFRGIEGLFIYPVTFM